MPKQEKDPLERWRAAEAAYAEALAPFVGDGEAPRLSKSELSELVSLRHRADKWRERYFKRCHEESGDES